MFAAEMNGSFINDIFRIEKSSADNSSDSVSYNRDNSSKDMSFHQDLQNKIDEQKGETFRAREREKVAYAFDSPAKPQETQGIHNNDLSDESTISTQLPTKVAPKTQTIDNASNVEQKEQKTNASLEDILTKLTSLLKKLDDENIEPTDELNKILASLASLLDKLSNKTVADMPSKDQLADISSKIKQINLTNPRTQENIPITFISKKDFAELVNKISTDLANKSMTQINTQEITSQIAELLEKLAGVIASSKKESQIIVPTFANEETKANGAKLEKSTKAPVDTIKVNTDEENKPIELNLNNEKITEEVPNKKQVVIKDKNEESLFNQNNKAEIKEAPPKVMSLDNDLSEFNTKINIKDVKELEAIPLPKTSNSNLEKQNQIMNQFRSYLTINKLKTDTEVNMRLYPRELGEVKIKITKEQIAGNENTQIVAKFQVSSAAVKAILESNFDSLKNDLQQNSNIVISALSVEINNKESNENNFSNFQDSNFSSNRKIKATEIKTENTLPEQILNNNEINSLA